MKTHFETMTNWECEKGVYLLQIARILQMDITSYGELSVNSNSGYTYLWLEDYPFSLYMPINCDIKRDDVYVLWTNYDNGEEIEESLKQFNDLEDIYEWVKSLEDENGLS
jgi:hypothetical protein